MAWELNADRPVYTQILEIIRTRIISGIYAPGSRLPSVRELAAEANPPTQCRELSWNWRRADWSQHKEGAEEP